MTTPVIGEGEKLITTVLLNGERLHVRVHASATGQHIFDQIVKHINLNETHYFGLMIIKDGEQQFLNLEDRLQKLAKYAPHLWKDDGSCNSSLVFTVFFRVKFYVENICLLQEQQTRHQYYLQLRKDVLENSIRVHDDTSMVLASYALQAELGDYDKNIHGMDYFIPQHYLPAKTIAKLAIPYIKNALPAMHQSHRGLTDAQAEIEFLKEAQKLTEYGVLFHRVYKKEYTKKVPYNLGICVRGLIIYEETGPIRNAVCKHPWAKIKKMSFKRRKFICEANTPNQSYSRITLYTANYKRSRYLLKMSSAFFHFQTKMQSKLAMMPDFMTQEDHLMPQSIPNIPSVRIERARSQDVIDVADNQQQQVILQQQRRATTLPRDHGSHKDQQQTTKTKAKPEAKQYTVDLQKKDGSFGFSIVGGIELGGIFVKDVTPGGPAAGSAQINAGERIVQVNKVSFENVTRREAINTLRNAPDRSKFIMETFGQNLIIEADASIITPLAVSAQSLALNQPQIPVVQTDRESDFIRVDIPKRDGSFGVGFTGGPELGGVYVKSLMPNGAAEVDGRIAIGDRIIEVDGTNVEGFSRKKIQDLMKVAQGSVCIIVERFKQIPSTGGVLLIDPEKVLRSSQNFLAVSLQKKNDSLGFSITGGLDLGGIFVKFLNANGPAALDGRLEIGDRIVAVNNVSLETVSRQQALEIIRNAGSPVQLIIEKCIAPENGLVEQNRPPVSNMNIIRSDSIKSLPTHGGVSRQPPMNQQQKTMTHSMHDIANLSTALVTSYAGHDVNGNYQRQQQGLNAQMGRPVQEVFVVNLPKHNGSFGISLTGGQEVGGIYVKAIQPNGAADIDGRIIKGDKIIEINARRMDACSRQEAVDWLKASQMMATFILERFSNSPSRPSIQQQQSSSQFSSFDGEFINVELTRHNGSFGLSLMGGPEMRGIFIKHLLNGGAAQTDGRICKGDRIVEINNVSIDGLNRIQVNELLKQASTSVNLIVEKMRMAEEVPPMDLDMYNIELRKGESGFGISVTGGGEVGGIYVKGILPGGSADATKINKGDRLVEVNGICMEGLTKPQAIDVLRKSPPVASMLFEKSSGFDNVILPESEFFVVELFKKQNGYGLSLTGGPEIDGVYVKSVQLRGAADHDGRIQRGDRLVTINGRNVENLTKQKCTEILKASQEKVILFLERCVVGDDLPPLDTVLTVVELSKGPAGFGLSLTGGPDIGGIFVKALLTNGGAEKDGRILIGDRVVEMNGISLDGFSRNQATDLLKNSGHSSTFVLERYKQKSKATNGRSMVSPARPSMYARGETRDSRDSRDARETGMSPPSMPIQFINYNGVSPAVPPRHVNSSSIPSRESAFKRLEQQQQQQQLLQHRHDPNRSPGHQHNISNKVSNPPSQHMNISHPLQESAPTSRNHSTIQRQMSQPSPEKQYVQSRGVDPNSAYNLVESSMRTLIQPADRGKELQTEVVHRGSPPRTEANGFGSIHSRIPLGPISSAIFGGVNRDTRDTVICVSNGRPTVQPMDPTSNYAASVAPSGVTRVIDSSYLSSVKLNGSAEPVSTSHKSSGLKWMSLGDGSSSSSVPSAGQQTSIYNTRATGTAANHGLENGTHSLPRSMSYGTSSSTQLSASGYLGGQPKIGANTMEQISSTGLNTRNQTQTDSVSRGQYHSLPQALRKPGGDYVMEVTLFKGPRGLGMNLAGGGNEGPVVIKKIAKGTAADDSGQLRLGDIILEINGKDVDGLNARDVIAMLRTCPSEVQLLIRRPAFGSMPSTTFASSSSYVGL